MQACSSTLYKMAQCLHLNCILISTSFLIPKQGKFYVNSCKYNVNAMKIVESTKQIQVLLFRIFWGKKLGGAVFLISVCGWWNPWVQSRWIQRANCTLKYLESWSSHLVQAFWARDIFTKEKIPTPCAIFGIVLDILRNALNKCISLDSHRSEAWIIRPVLRHHVQRVENQNRGSTASGIRLMVNEDRELV